MKTKFMKNLSILLAALMVTACITIPAAAEDETVDSILINQDFENCDNLDGTGFSYWPAVRAEENGNVVGQLTDLEIVDGNKVLKITTSDMTTGDPWYSNAAQVFLMENLAPYTDGSMTVTFDVAPGLRGDQGTFGLMLRTKNGDIDAPGLVWNQAELANWKSTIYGGDYDGAPRLVSGHWYTITTEFRFTESKMVSTIKDKETGKQLGSGEYTYDATPTEMYFNQFDSKKMSKDTAPDPNLKVSTYVDNVKVEYHHVDWADDFDSYNSNADLTANNAYEIPTNWGFDASTVSIAENGSGKALKLEPESDKQSVLVRYINKATSKLGIDIDVTPGSADDNKLVLFDKAGNLETIVSFNTDSIFIRYGNEWKKIGTFIQGNTYKVRIIVDLDKDIIEAAVNTEDGAPVARGSAPYTGNAVDEFRMAVGAWNGKAGSALFDNLRITSFPVELPADSIPNTTFVTDTDFGARETGDGKKGVLRFLANLEYNEGATASYGFMLINMKEYSPKTEQKEVGTAIKSGSTYCYDINNIPQYVNDEEQSKVGFYAVPYVVYTNNSVAWGSPFTKEGNLNWNRIVE